MLQEMAMLEDARLNVQRVKGLSGKAVFTQEEMQTRESALHVAEARYASSLELGAGADRACSSCGEPSWRWRMQNRQDAVLKAPFVGVIQERHVAPGSYVNVGQPVATLVRIDPLRFRAGVPERAAARRERRASRCACCSEGQPKPIEAQISRISPTLDVSSRALMIEADIENTIRPVAFRACSPRAKFWSMPISSALAVPLTSVVTFGGVEKVWTVKDNQAQPRPIRTGRRDGKFVEVLDGLQAGDVDSGQRPAGARRRRARQSRPPPDKPDDRAALLGQ